MATNTGFTINMICKSTFIIHCLHKSDGSAVKADGEGRRGETWKVYAYFSLEGTYFTNVFFAILLILLTLLLIYTIVLLQS
jgi:hypothetical protein